MPKFLLTFKNKLKDKLVFSPNFKFEVTSYRKSDPIYQLTIRLD